MIGVNNKDMIDTIVFCCVHDIFIDWIVISEPSESLFSTVLSLIRKSESAC